MVTIDLDPGPAALGNPRLVRAIIDEMAGGAISFERFMTLALYHPEFGYYRKPGRIGPNGDFLTSPAIHPMFGWTVAAWLRELWLSLGRPPEFTVFEPGAGEGALATAMLDWAEGREDGFRDALRYVALEPNAHGDDRRVTWAAGPVSAAEYGAVVSNELFDAFPVRLFDAGGRGPVEVLVRWDGERFVETPGSVVTVDGAPEIGRFEANPHVYGAMQGLCGLIERGAVLTFDYGHAQEDLWASWRTQGTLLCFYRHTAHEDPLIHVGEQDITSHVNLDELAAAAVDEGFAVHGPVRQAHFLYALGAAALVEAVRGEMAEYFTRRRALQTLTDAAGLGRIRVLAASRGVDGPLPGFEEEAP